MLLARTILGFKKELRQTAVVTQKDHAVLKEGEYSYLTGNDPWVFVSIASVPAFNPLKARRPYIFHAVIDNEDHEALQRLLQRHPSNFR